MTKKIASLFYLSLSVIITFLLGLKPLVGPDSQDLLILVQNMNEYGCFSYSSNCTPTTSDLGPGYPALIYMFNLFIGLDPKGIAFAQGICICMVAFALASHVSHYYKFGTKSFSTIFSLVLLNPLLIGWNRFIHPDLVVYLLVIIMMITLDKFRRSRDSRELFIYSFLVSVGSLFRYEFIIFSAPIIVLWINCHFVRQPLFIKNPIPGAFYVLVIICFLGLSFWSCRNLSLGLPALRNGYFILNSERNFAIEAWIKSWTVSQWDYSIGLYPYFSGKLDLIHPPAWATSNAIQSGLATTSSFISSSLESLIKGKTNQINSSFGLIFSINTQRIAWLLFNPFWSGGLGDLITKPLHPSVPEVAGYILPKLYSLFGRITVYTFSIIAVFSLNLRRPFQVETILFYSMLLVFLVYVFLLLFLCQLETRYLTAPLLALLLISGMILASSKTVQNNQ